MGASGKVKRYLRACKYHHFFYFWHNKFYRRLLVLLYTKESGIRYGFHRVQFDGMIRKMSEEQFNGDFAKTFQILYGKEFAPLVMRVIQMMKQFSFEINDIESTLRTTNIRYFWKQRNLIKVLKEILFAKTNHMQLENLLNSEYGFYGGVYWLASELEEGKWNVLESLIRYAKDLKVMQPKILLACMCVNRAEAKQYLEMNMSEEYTYLIDAMPQFHKDIFFGYLRDEFTFQDVKKYSSLQRWTGLHDLNEDAEVKMYGYLQKAVTHDFDINTLGRNWMATYSALFILGATDLEQLKNALKNIIECGTAAQHRGVMRYLANPSTAFLLQEATFYAKDCDNLELLAYLYDSWRGINEKPNDYNVTSLKTRREELLHVFISWLDKLPKTDYTYQAESFLGRSYHLYRTELITTASILAPDCEANIERDARILCNSLEAVNQETIIRVLPSLFRFADRNTLKQTLLRFSIHEDEAVSKAAMKALRTMLSSLRLYQKPYIHRFKRFAYLDYMDPINEQDLAYLHQHVSSDHEVFQVIKEHKKIKTKKPEKVKTVALKEDTTFGKMLSQQDDFKPNQLTKFFKEGMFKDRSPFSSFSSDLLAHFVRSYQEQGKHACEQLNFKQTVYVHFRLFALPDMSVYSKLMYAKMDLLFHIKQFRDQGKASLSHIDTKQMNQDLLEHMLQFDLNEYAMFFLRMLEQVNLVMDRTYLTTYYRVKPYRVENEWGIDADFIQYWIHMGRIAQNEDTKRATTKLIYQIAQKGNFHHLCGLTIQDIDYLYEQGLLQKHDIKALFISDYAPKKVMEDQSQWVHQLFQDRREDITYGDALETVLAEIEDDYVQYLLCGHGYNSSPYPIYKVDHILVIMERVKLLLLDGKDIEAFVEIINYSCLINSMEDMVLSREDILTLYLAKVDLPREWLKEAQSLSTVLFPYRFAIPIRFLPAQYNELSNILKKLDEDTMAMLDHLVKMYPKLGLILTSTLKQAVSDQLNIADLEAMMNLGENFEAATAYCMLPYTSDEQTKRQLTFLSKQMCNYGHLLPILGAVAGYEDFHLFKKTFL